MYGILILFWVTAQKRLEELQGAIGNAEQQVLKVSGELRQLEDALAQKKVHKGLANWLAFESVWNCLYRQQCFSAILSQMGHVWVYNEDSK